MPRREESKIPLFIWSQPKLIETIKRDGLLEVLRCDALIALAASVAVTTFKQPDSETRCPL